MQIACDDWWLIIGCTPLKAVTSNYLKKKSEKDVLQADFGSKPQIQSDGFVMLNVLSVCLHTIMKINSKTTSSMQII